MTKRHGQKGIAKDMTVKPRSSGSSGGYSWITCPECGATLKSINVITHLNRSHPGMPDTERQEIIKKYHTEATVGKPGASPKKMARTGYMSRSRKNDVIFVCALISILAAILGGYFYYIESTRVNYEDVSDNPPNPNSTDTLAEAPDFSIREASGATMSLRYFQNNVVVLHFLQILSDCQGTYFYKSDDRAGYDSSMSGYINLSKIDTIHQFEELKTVSANYRSNNVAIISIIVPPGCCGDPLKFSQDFKNNYNLGWNVASDTLQYDIWYKYLKYLPSASNVFTRDPTILILDKEQHVVYDSGFMYAEAISSKINPLL